MDTGVAKLADFGLSKTIASLAPIISAHRMAQHPTDASKFPEGATGLNESSGSQALGVQASGASFVSAGKRGSGANVSRHKIVQLVSPSPKGTYDGCAFIMFPPRRVSCFIPQMFSHKKVCCMALFCSDLCSLLSALGFHL